MAFLGHFKGSQSFKDLPGCHNQCFPQIFASNWQLSHLVSGGRQVTSQCAFGQLSVVHSRPAGQTDRQHQNIPLRNLWQGIIKSENPLPRCVRTESLSVYYVYLKVTKGHNSISSWCNAMKLGVSCRHMQVHILWQTYGKASYGRTTPKQYPPENFRREIKITFHQLDNKQYQVNVTLKLM